jgi:hypothetical protein
MRAGRIAAAVAAGIAALMTAIPVAPATAQEPQTQPTAYLAVSVVSALESLAVKGRAPKTGYSRDAFGPEWKDVNGNGCDTRNDILRRDLQRTKVRGGCEVQSGVLSPDPYTGHTNAYVHGQSTVDIDHVVSLSDAWQKGAFRWTELRRTSLANDPLNLLAVDFSANRQKGDGDAATWLPSNRGYWCPFVARQVAVKTKYGLWVTAAEKAAITRVLARCPGQLLPTGS